MSESELEYRRGALELEHRLHNIGQFEQFKAFRVVQTDGRMDERPVLGPVVYIRAIPRANR